MESADYIRDVAVDTIHLVPVDDIGRMLYGVLHLIPEKHPQRLPVAAVVRDYAREVASRSLEYARESKSTVAMDNYRSYTKVAVDLSEEIRKSSPF